MQLVQGVVMLMSITIILRFNFGKEKKNISYVFLFLCNFKVSFHSVLLFNLFCFREKNGGKNLTINLNKFCLNAVAGFATQCANRIRETNLAVA